MRMGSVFVPTCINSRIYRLYFFSYRFVSSFVSISRSVGSHFLHTCFQFLSQIRTSPLSPPSTVALPETTFYLSCCLSLSLSISSPGEPYLILRHAPSFARPIIPPTHNSTPHPLAPLFPREILPLLSSCSPCYPFRQAVSPAGNGTDLTPFKAQLPFYLYAAIVYPRTSSRALSRVTPFAPFPLF
jgi:hypothetical protein